MTPAEREAYAAHLVLEHARDVEFLSVLEMYEEYEDADGPEISDDDARAVHDLISKADVTVEWSRGAA